MWDKAGADALVWHTDAYYWSKQEGDFDEQTTDDWDVDYSEHFGYGGLGVWECRRVWCCVIVVVLVLCR